MIGVRPAHREDAPDIRLLLRQLGYDLPLDGIRDRLGALTETDRVLLAWEGDANLGLIALHCASMLHVARPVARITTLVVSDMARRRGVGRILVDAGAAWARQAGCGILELTTALRRTDAQAFYRSLGFEAAALRLHRILDAGAP